MLGTLAALLVYALVAGWGGFWADHETLAATFMVAIVVVTAYRLLIVARFERLYAAGPGRWRRLFGLGMLAHAAVWGSLLAILAPLYGIDFNFFVVGLYIIGVTTALSSAWMAALRTRQVYILLMFVPGTVMLASLAQPGALIVALLMFFYGLYLFRLFVEQHNTFWHALAREKKAAPRVQEEPGLVSSGDIQLSLVYRLAHELRTPMNSMLGMLSLLGDTRLEPEQQEYHSVATQSGKLLLSLIDDVLDYSRILTGRITLNPDYFELRNSVEQCVDAYGPIAQSRGLELTCVMDRHLPRRLRGDRERFLQVLNNLVSNAIKFSERGEIRIELEYNFSPVPRDQQASQGIAPGQAPGELMVQVSDQGVGIEPERARRLFEDEFRGPHSDTTNAGHQGFGLLVCKGLVEAMSGRIGVNSVPGSGSTFWFTMHLPAQPDIQERPRLARAMERRQVLVTGAAPGTVAALEEELEVLGVSCQSSRDYDHGLQALREGHRERCDFDLLLVDTRERRAGALNLCRTVLEDPALKSVQVILLATIEERAMERVQRLAQRHFMPVLTKPVHRAGLRSVLGHLYGVEEETAVEESFRDSSEEQARRRDYRLLLVEDNEINQLVTRGMLDKLGYQVKTVSAGEEALALTRREDFDLILMDCMMPAMDGFEVARLIREMESDEDRRVPIIAMTANTQEGIQARCLAAGMDDYLAKPVHLEELETILRHWLPGEALPDEEDAE